MLTACSGNPAPPAPAATAQPAAATTTTAKSAIGQKFLPRTPSISIRYSMCQDQEKAADRGGACSGAFTDMVLLALDVKREAPPGSLRETADLLVNIGEDYGTQKCGSGYALAQGSTHDLTCAVNALGLDNSWDAMVTWLSL
jgi:hypothetical protein